MCRHGVGKEDQQCIVFVQGTGVGPSAGISVYKLVVAVLTAEDSSEMIHLEHVKVSVRYLYLYRSYDQLFITY